MVLGWISAFAIDSLHIWKGTTSKLKVYTSFRATSASTETISIPLKALHVSARQGNAKLQLNCSY